MGSPSRLLPYSDRTPHTLSGEGEIPLTYANSGRTTINSYLQPVVEIPWGHNVWPPEKVKDPVERLWHAHTSSFTAGRDPCSSTRSNGPLSMLGQGRHRLRETPARSADRENVPKILETQRLSVDIAALSVLLYAT